MSVIAQTKKATHSSPIPGDLTQHRVLTINLAVELSIINRTRRGVEPALRRDESKTLQQQKSGMGEDNGQQRKSPTAAPAWISWSFASPVLQGAAEAEDQSNKKRHTEETGCSWQPDFSLLLSSDWSQNKMWHECDKRLFPFHKLPKERKCRKSTLPHEFITLCHPKPDNSAFMN